MNSEKWSKHFNQMVHSGLDGKVVNLTIGDTSLECVIAAVHETRVRGLSEHAQLPLDGMIFIYDGDHTAKFQRQSMSMDISIWFYDAQGNLVGNGWTEGVATAGKPYRYVVETHADVILEGKLKLNELVEISDDASSS
jgi:uncharacterized membrane protein (UPF0127 family)